MEVRDRTIKQDEIIITTKSIRNTLKVLEMGGSFSVEKVGEGRII